MSMPEKNRQLIRDGVKLILRGLGEDMERNGLAETPDRVARLYEDVLDGNFIQLADPTAFEPESYNGVVAVHHVPFYAFCEHHLVPFMGTVAIGYLPDKRLLGISKLVRIFRYHCKKITIQERITQAAVDDLERIAKPRGVICHVSAAHMCMSLRGVKSHGALTSTLAYSGEFASSTELRQQFVSEANRRSD